MILLMDPSKQSYELMQIWVDRSIDSIRDLVQVLQHKLPVKWKQAYDGLFQVRGHRFTQLINIIRLVKYDIQPHEILVAKPWSMTAKVTITIAGSAIRHLTRLGVIATDCNDDKERCRNRRQQPRNDDSPLVLSKVAQDRAYFPEGILDHHHAMQFITFSPSFESTNDSERPEIAAPATTTNTSSTSTKLISSRKFDEAYSSLLASEKQNQGLRSEESETKGERRGTACPLVPPSYRQKTFKSLSSRRGNENKYSITDSESRDSGACRAASYREQKRGRVYGGMSSPGSCLAKLNCLRTSNHYESADKNDDIIHSKPSRASSMTSLSEEEEKRWVGYSMKPINEEQSLASGSIVSMSAPLLSPESSQALNNKSRRRHSFVPSQQQVTQNSGRKNYSRTRNGKNREVDNECEF